MRTRPCPCGSGRAARDCCGRFKRLSEADAARAYLHRQARAGRELLGPFSPGGVAGLRRELAVLPERHDELIAALSAAAGTHLPRMLTAIKRRRAGDEAAVVEAVLVRAELPLVRVALAKTLTALREDGLIDDHLAAAGLVDLDTPASMLLRAAWLSVVERARGIPAHVH